MASKVEQQQWVFQSDFVLSDLVTPGARMVVVEVWQDDDGNFGATQHPVVALARRVQREWSKWHDGGGKQVPLLPGTRAARRKAGWVLDDVSQIVTALIVDSDYDIIPWDDPLRQSKNARSGLVVLTGDPKEDAEAIAGKVEYLQDLLRTVARSSSTCAERIER